MAKLKGSSDEPVRWSRLVIVFAARIHESGQKTRVQLQNQKTNSTEQRGSTFIVWFYVREISAVAGQTSTAILSFSEIDRLCQTST